MTTLRSYRVIRIVVASKLRGVRFGAVRPYHDVHAPQAKLMSTTTAHSFEALVDRKADCDIVRSGSSLPTGLKHYTEEVGQAPSGPGVRLPLFPRTLPGDVAQPAARAVGARCVRRRGSVGTPFRETVGDGAALVHVWLRAAHALRCRHAPRRRSPAPLPLRLELPLQQPDQLLEPGVPWTPRRWHRAPAGRGGAAVLRRGVVAEVDRQRRSRLHPFRRLLAWIDPDRLLP